MSPASPILVAFRANIWDCCPMWSLPCQGERSWARAGGVGKTRLASEVAVRQEADYAADKFLEVWRREAIPEAGATSASSLPSGTGYTK